MGTWKFHTTAVFPLIMNSFIFVYRYVYITQYTVYVYIYATYIYKIC